jgi:hypothetical protein
MAAAEQPQRLRLPDLETSSAQGLCLLLLLLLLLQLPLLSTLASRNAHGQIHRVRINKRGRCSGHQDAILAVEEVKVRRSSAGEAHPRDSVQRQPLDLEAFAKTNIGWAS